jgi:hypothetical protein
VAISETTSGRCLADRQNGIQLLLVPPVAAGSICGSFGDTPQPRASQQRPRPVQGSGDEDRRGRFCARPARSFRRSKGGQRPSTASNVAGQQARAGDIDGALATVQLLNKVEDRAEAVRGVAKRSDFRHAFAAETSIRKERQLMPKYTYAVEFVCSAKGPPHKGAGHFPETRARSLQSSDEGLSAMLVSIATNSSLPRCRRRAHGYRIVRYRSWSRTDPIPSSCHPGNNTAVSGACGLAVIVPEEETENPGVPRTERICYLSSLDECIEVEPHEERRDQLDVPRLQLNGTFCRQ